jgi:hypothetical protein
VVPGGVEVLIIATFLFVVLIALVARRGRAGGEALRILNARYASGEIGKDDYERCSGTSSGSYRVWFCGKNPLFRRKTQDERGGCVRC